MPSSDVKICSNAMLLVGHHAISSLAEDERAEALYPTSYEDVLTQHQWNIARRKVALSRLVDEPLNEYKYQYQIPADCLVIHRTYPSTNYKIYEDKLYSNHNEVEIDYTFKPPEASLPPYFVTMMEFLMASKFAYPVASNKALATEYREAYKDQRRVAKLKDSQAKPQDPPSDQPFVDIRAGDR